MTNLATLLDDTAYAHPDRTAVVAVGTQLSYFEIQAAANQVANLLAANGIGRGDTVALSMPNIPHFTIVYFGILKAGACVVPLNVLLKSREIAYHLKDSNAKAYFAFEGTSELPIGDEAVTGFEHTDTCTSLFLIHADPATAMPWTQLSPKFETVDVDDDDTAVILYTSGTTGQPKGAELRHRNMRDNALASEQILAVDRARPDTYLCALPLFHSFGQTVIQNSGIASGGTIVMMPRFDPLVAVRTMLDNHVTVFAGVPTMYWNLLTHTDRDDVDRLASTLRIASSGGAALPAEVHKDFKAMFGVTILEGYGLSETSPVASFSVYGDEPRVGSIGLPIPGVEMKLVDASWAEVPNTVGAIGEIAIKGHNVMKGYYNRPDATAEAIKDGWFRTGDLATRDADGYYYIVDRAKDMIIRGGFNVYPREIEELLMTHPSVSLVAVVGVPHESHGEEIKAVVVKTDPSDKVTESDLVEWSKEQLAAYKYPRIVEFVDAIPMTSTGKLLKRKLV